MATTATTSQGTLLKVSISSTFTTITGIKGVNSPGINWEFDEITNLGSTSNFKEWMTIMKDPGTVDFTMVWDPTNTAQAYLRTTHLAGSLESFKLIGSDGGAYEFAFSAYVAKCEVKYEQGKAQVAEVSLRCSGAVSDTP